MDLVPLIDLLGESGAALAGGAIVGAVFGFLAQRSAFCTRSAVLDIVRGRDLTALATWSAGFAAAILGVQLLLAFGHLDVVETRFFSTALDSGLPHSRQWAARRAFGRVGRARASSGSSRSRKRDGGRLPRPPGARAAAQETVRWSRARVMPT